MSLELIWFVLLFVLLIGYAIQDGYDLGVGILHLFSRDEVQRRVAFAAIGPIWDGHEVWLLTAGGALFAAFAPVYATIFSGFYLAMILVLVALIGRAIAIEFRSKTESARWRGLWDAIFFGGSLVTTLLLGVAFGNILRGVPIDAKGNYTGTFFGLLNPFSLGVGVLALAACTMHGTIFLAGKSQGEMRRRLSRLAAPLWATYTVLYLGLTAWAYFALPHLFENAKSPVAWALMVLAAVGIVAVVPLARRERFGAALAASSVAIGSAMGLAATGLYPRLVPSLTDLSFSLTVTNSCSTPMTLKAMLIIALLGMPIVLIYTVLVHRIFKGPATASDEGY